MTDARARRRAAGEDAVAAWYAAAGYRCSTATGACARASSISSSATRGTIVFCEVKTRRGDAFGLPAEAVTARKRQRLRLLAGRWLAAHDAGAGTLRFDVASVRPDGRGGWDVDVLPNAF